MQQKNREQQSHGVRGVFIVCRCDAATVALAVRVAKVDEHELVWIISSVDGLGAREHQSASWVWDYEMEPRVNV